MVYEHVRHGMSLSKLWLTNYVYFIFETILISSSLEEIYAWVLRQLLEIVKSISMAICYHLFI